MERNITFGTYYKRKLGLIPEKDFKVTTLARDIYHFNANITVPEDPNFPILFRACDKVLHVRFHAKVLDCLRHWFQNGNNI